MLSPDLAVELRAARPVAPPDVRERVRAVAANAREPRRRLALPSLGRAALVGAAAVLAVSVGTAALHGITHSGRKQTALPKEVHVPAVAGVQAQPQLDRTRAATMAKLPFAPSRLQQYTAALRVQVADREALSVATRRAMRVARLLGGYVAAASYRSPAGGRASAAMIVRVPVDRVQDAIEEYAGLGTILGQNLRLSDVTKAVQQEAKEIVQLRAEIAALEAGGISAGERARYERAKERLAYLTRTKAATVRRAQLAKVWLGIVTKPKAAAAPAGRFERTLDDAGSVLVRELEILLYALIVAGPLLLLGAAAIAGTRLAQRRRDAHLLERT
jgi:hypothetical protein